MVGTEAFNMLHVKKLELNRDQGKSSIFFYWLVSAISSPILRMVSCSRCQYVPSSWFSNHHEKAKKTLKCAYSAAVNTKRRRHVHVRCTSTSEVCSSTSHTFELPCSVFLRTFVTVTFIIYLYLQPEYLRCRCYNALVWIVSCFGFDWQGMAYWHRKLHPF